MKARIEGPAVQVLVCLGLFFGRDDARAQTATSNGALSHYDLAAAPAQRIELPGDLSESPASRSHGTTGCSLMGTSEL